MSCTKLIPSPHLLSMQPSEVLFCLMVCSEWQQQGVSAGIISASTAVTAALSPWSASGATAPILARSKFAHSSCACNRSRYLAVIANAHGEPTKAAAANQTVCLMSQLPFKELLKFMENCARHTEFVNLFAYRSMQKEEPAPWCCCAHQPVLRALGL